MRKRTLAREFALQILYELDVRGDDAWEDIDAALDQRAVPEEARAYARELVVGVREHRAHIDALISGTAEHWEIGRMAMVDRNILRLATYELLHRRDVPPLVVINEAIELAKRFSTKASGAFVNGILDAIRMRVRPNGDSDPRTAPPGA